MNFVSHMFKTREYFTNILTGMQEPHPLVFASSSPAKCDARTRPWPPLRCESGHQSRSSTPSYGKENAHVVANNSQDSKMTLMVTYPSTGLTVIAKGSPSMSVMSRVQLGPPSCPTLMEYRSRRQCAV